MDILLFLIQKLYHDEINSTFFIFRMWLGYGFDAAEFVSVMIRYGFVYANIVWMYVFFGYLGLLVLVALLITVVLREFKISDRKISSCLAYFKLTSIVNAAMIFFQLYLQDQRDEVAIILLVVTGIDIGFDFLEMSAGCAALGMNKDKVYPYF